MLAAGVGTAERGWWVGRVNFAGVVYFLSKSNLGVLLKSEFVDHELSFRLSVGCDFVGFRN